VVEYRSKKRLCLHRIKYYNCEKEINVNLLRKELVTKLLKMAPEFFSEYGLISPHVGNSFQLLKVMGQV
jgi:hypothetical protein